MSVAPQDIPGKALLEVRDLTKHFRVGGGIGSPPQVLRAVDGVTFDVHPGETFGIVGESGCGKTTLARTIIRLYKPTSGTMQFEGRDIGGPPENQLRWMRGKMQMIFQDPYASLNPRMTVHEILKEPMGLSQGMSPDRKWQRTKELVSMVGLSLEHLSRYPHEFSGGQRQRIGIARALAVNPRMILADEPISALDVSIQAQIVNLLEELQEKLGLTYVFIAHDLSMVKHISRRVMVMYLGKVMEIAPSHDLYTNPLHPYTKALLSAVPVPDPLVEAERRGTVLKGEVPSPMSPPSGCPFRTRCVAALKKCAEVKPRLYPQGADHQVACHRVYPTEDE